MKALLAISWAAFTLLLIHSLFLSNSSEPSPQTQLHQYNHCRSLQGDGLAWGTHSACSRYCERPEWCRAEWTARGYD